ncbi:hypothetical protein D3C74_316410 [compost metagenome]
MDHVHLGRVDVRVAAQDVRAHARRDSDDAGRGLVGRLLGPARQRVAAPELLGLPRSQRLERVRAEDVRDPVQERGQVAAEVRVPGVRVHEVGSCDVVGHRQVHAERPQHGVRRGERAGHRVPRDPLLAAGSVEAAHAHVDAFAQHTGQLGDVDARASVDVGRVLTGQQVDSHAAHASALGRARAHGRPPATLSHRESPATNTWFGPHEHRPRP